MAKKYSLRSNKSHRIALIGVGILLLYMATAVLFHIWPLHDTSPSEVAKTTSKATSAQANYKGDNKSIPKTTTKPTASATDQYGAIVSPVPSSSDWTTSPDGTSLVVYQPVKNSVFMSGSSVYGSATSNAVSFRLSDSSSGLLSSGTARVVNGKFSIKLSYTTNVRAGNIEIFNQKDPYGPESNNILIPVRFQ